MNSNLKWLPLFSPDEAGGSDGTSLPIRQLGSGNMAGGLAGNHVMLCYDSRGNSICSALCILKGPGEGYSDDRPV